MYYVGMVLAICAPLCMGSAFVVTPFYLQSASDCDLRPKSANARRCCPLTEGGRTFKATDWKRGQGRGKNFSVLPFSKSPKDGQPLGDRWVKEVTEGLAVEPPGIFKRLFSAPRNIRRTVTVDGLVVPVIGARDGWGEIRQSLVDAGVYPGVEYRVLEVTLKNAMSEEQTSLGSVLDASEGAFDAGDVFLTLRPVYPLISRLERQWPVQLAARDVPVLLTPFAYNTATAWASLITSATLLAVGFVLSQAVTLSYIPSHSMEPTLQVGDLVLVEKVSRSTLIRKNDIVFFRPPEALRSVVTSVGGTLRESDLFAKRVAGIPGDTVSVDARGRVAVEAPKHRQGGLLGGKMSDAMGPGKKGAIRIPVVDTTTGGEAEGSVIPANLLERIHVMDGHLLPAGSLFVLGDNPGASVDSRVWGLLDKQQIVGHPLLRIFPLSRFGLIN